MTTEPDEQTEAEADRALEDEVGLSRFDVVAKPNGDPVEYVSLEEDLAK